MNKINSLVLFLALVFSLGLSSCEDDLPAPLPDAPDLVIQRCLMVFSERAGEEKVLKWENPIFEEEDEVITADKGRTMYCHDFFVNEAKRLNDSRPVDIDRQVYFSFTLETMAKLIRFILEWLPLTGDNLVK